MHRYDHILLSLQHLPSCQIPSFHKAFVEVWAELEMTFPLQPKKHHQHLKELRLHTCTHFYMCICAAACLQYTVVLWKALDSPSMGPVT